MKNRYYQTLMRVLPCLIFICQLPAGANPYCKAVAGLTKMNERIASKGVALGNRLDEKINGHPDIPTAPRFQNPELGTRWDAMLQVRYGLGRCEHHWPGGLDDETAEALAALLLSRRVMDAVDVDYEAVGAGLGKVMARYSGNADANVRARKLMADVQRFAAGEPFSSAGYTEAHYFRDLNDILSDQPSLNEFQVGSVSDFANTQTNFVSDGNFVEVRAIASRRGEGILGVSVDAQYPDLVGVNTGIDLLTDAGAYNIARSYRRIEDKLDSDNLEDIARAIVKARSDGRPFKFVIGVSEPSASAELTARIDALNVKIRAVQGVPADFPDFTADDIIIQIF